MTNGNEKHPLQLFLQKSTKLLMNTKPETVTGIILPPEKLKGWQKDYGHFAVEPDGTIFLSWAHAGASRMEVLLCASYDGEPMMLVGDTPLYRTQWLWDNFPKMRAAISKATQRISDAQEKGLRLNAVGLSLLI
jgi:hypothetical protein